MLCPGRVLDFGWRHSRLGMYRSRLVESVVKPSGTIRRSELLVVGYLILSAFHGMWPQSKTTVKCRVHRVGGGILYVAEHCLSLEFVVEL